MAQIALEDVGLELPGVREVAVVRQADAVGRVDVHRLRLGGARRTGRRIAHVADAHVPAQPLHVALLEDLAHQAVAFAQPQTAIGLGVPRDHPRRVLAAMLQGKQRVVDLVEDRALADDSNDTTHD